MMNWKAAVVPALGLLLLAVAPAAAQVRPVVHLTPALAGFDGDTIHLTALNVCEVPVQVKMTLLDGETGRPVGEGFNDVVEPQRTAAVDTRLDFRAVSAKRVYSRVEVSAGPGGAGPMINCVALHGAPVIGQMEILQPGGGPVRIGLLLPAVQKVREAR